MDAHGGVVERPHPDAQLVLVGGPEREDVVVEAQHGRRRVDAERLADHVAVAFLGLVSRAERPTQAQHPLAVGGPDGHPS